MASTYLHPPHPLPTWVAMPYYFCIVGTRDNLLYEADLSVQLTTPVTQTQNNTEQTRNSGIFGFSSAFGAWTAPLVKQPTPSAAGTPSTPPVEDSRASASALTNDHHVLQMIAHGSLDVLEDKQFVDSSMYVLRRTHPAT